jgi:hypothetical protein
VGCQGKSFQCWHGRVPTSQSDKVIYLNATDPTQPYGYNPLRHVSEDRIAMAASGMMDVFKIMWPDAWGVRMEHILRNVLMALLEQPNATLHDVLRIFSDNEFRKKIAKSLRNDTVRTFLLKEFERFSFGYRADGTAPIQNKARPHTRQVLHLVSRTRRETMGWCELRRGTASGGNGTKWLPGIKIPFLIHSGFSALGASGDACLH